MGDFRPFYTRVNVSELENEITLYLHGDIAYEKVEDKI